MCRLERMFVEEDEGTRAVYLEVKGTVKRSD